MYNDKAIDKLIEQYGEEPLADLLVNKLCGNDGDCPSFYGLKESACGEDSECFSCWKQALSTEPEAAMTKKSIEKKYGVRLERDKGYDGGAWYWLCFDSKENMNWLCNGYTLAEIDEKLKTLTEPEGDHGN